MQRQAETIGKRWDYCADGYDAIVQNEFAEELAEKLSVSRQAVAKWESGQVYPEITNFIQISNLFNVTVDCCRRFYIVSRL